MQLIGILISLVTYELGRGIQRQLRSPIFNPLLIGILLTMAILVATGIPLDTYRVGGSVITFFLGPATVALAVPLYRQLDTLKKHIWPILTGIFTGSAFSIILISVIMSTMSFDTGLLVSMLPKSVTTPIGMEISKTMGGIPEITIGAIVLTGIFGAMTAPWLLRITGIIDPIAKGIAIGTASHAVGTTKALELGEMEGAMSSLSIGIAGIVTVILAPVIHYLMKLL